jgi:hypothetical protein
VKQQRRQPIETFVQCVYQAPKQRQYMIFILNSEEQGTRRAVTPSGKENSPAEGEKLNPSSELRGVVRLRDRLRDMYLQIASFLSVHLGEFDFVCVNIPVD